MTGGLLAGLLVYLLRKNDLDSVTLIGCSLILAGGIGNLIDRVVFNGVVTDFLNIGIGSLRTGIFNIADVVIMLGVGLVIYRSFSERKQVDTRFNT